MPRQYYLETPLIPEEGGNLAQVQSTKILKDPNGQPRRLFKFNRNYSGRREWAMAWDF
jgi:hypothetical protein